MFIGFRLGLELFRKRYVTLAAAFTLLLIIAPVYGAPNLKVGSTASYSIAASVSTTQSCSASPANYYNEACLGIYPSTAIVTIYDNMTCSATMFSCGFSPAFLTVPVGTIVVWQNTGRLTHSVVSSDTANLVPDPFNSGPLNQGGSFSHVFAQEGIYHYYDGNYPFLKASVSVNVGLPSPPTPMPSAFQVGLNGNMGWKVEGLSSSTANLLVSHNLGVSISVPQLPGLTITPVTESGTLVQSIDLATRAESAGTATDLIEHLLDAYASASSSSYGYNSGFGNIISQMSASATSDLSYTPWWVNGPLSNGSPVQVMDGWASVTGSETLNLGSLGNVQAWIVTSQFSQSVNLTVPSSPFAGPSPNAQAALNLNFLWTYDKGSDLLVRSLANGTATMHSVSSTQVPTNGYCVSYQCSYTTVQVTRDMRLVITLALHLISTSLSLDQRMRSGASTIDMASFLSSMMSTPWMAFSVVGVAAGAIIAFSLWLTRRVRESAMPEANPGPVAAPPTPAP